MYVLLSDWIEMLFHGQCSVNLCTDHFNVYQLRVIGFRILKHVTNMYKNANSLSLGVSGF